MSGGLCQEKVPPQRAFGHWNGEAAEHEPARGQEESGQCSQAHGREGWEVDLMILIGSFQLIIFCDSMISALITLCV